MGSQTSDHEESVTNSGMFYKFSVTELT